MDVPYYRSKYVISILVWLAFGEHMSNDVGDSSKVVVRLRVRVLEGADR